MRVGTRGMSGKMSKNFLCSAWHDYFDVSPDENEERWTDEMWIADVRGRLKTELECGPEAS